MPLSVDVTLERAAFEVAAAFEARNGETVALLGPNGAGKSTLVAAIAGLIVPSAGAIRLDDTELDGPDVHVPPERRPIGVVFQDLLLFPHLSAIENVAFPLRARRVGGTDARTRAAAMLERLGASAHANARPSTLSGGEAQRVALARALVGEPGLLLLDEPLSALDVGARMRVRDVVREELRRFAGVRILVTHDPTEAMTLADRLVLLEDGRVTQIGTPDEIRRGPRSRYAADLVGVNAFTGSLTPVEEGVGQLDTGDGTVLAPWPDGMARGAAVIALVRPTAVTLSSERPLGSARNAFTGQITSVAVEGHRARVRIATNPPLVADVTLGSVERIGLREGAEVWASFKAIDVDVVPS